MVNDKIASEREMKERSPWGIRAKIFSLVILSALLPTALVGTSSYWTARNLLTSKLSDQLNTRAALAAAKAMEWFQEREHDARVFASSGIVVENLDRGTRTRHRASTRAYLAEVQRRYPIYRALAVLDAAGGAVATAGEIGDATIRENALTLEWRAKMPTLWVQEPIRRNEGTILGHFVMRCDFESLREHLSANGTRERVRLIARDDRVVLAQPEGAERVEGDVYHMEEGTITERRDARGAAVLATAHAVDVPGLDEILLVHVETEKKFAFAAVDELRNRIILMSAIAAGVVISLAFSLILSLTRPIESLIEGAHAMADGDYPPELPVRSRDEIGYLTEVFNRMTAALKESHERLHHLSTTDELTKLVNRRQLRTALVGTLQEAERTKQPFSLIMIDIDHFKQFNDQLGHIHGDELLAGLGSYLLSNLRATDVAARYGGEEFLVILPDTEIAEAREKAEVLREEFSSAHQGDGKVTLSLGVASWPRDGRSVKEIIEAADRALYSAKKRGRNRVIAAPKARSQRTSPR